MDRNRAIKVLVDKACAQANRIENDEDRKRKHHEIFLAEKTLREDTRKATDLLAHLALCEAVTHNQREFVARAKQILLGEDPE